MLPGIVAKMRPASGLPRELQDTWLWSQYARLRCEDVAEGDGAIVLVWLDRQPHFRIVAPPGGEPSSGMASDQSRRSGNALAKFSTSPDTRAPSDAMSLRYVQRRILGFLRRDSRPEQTSSLSLTLLLDEMSNPVIHAASSQVMADCNRYTVRLDAIRGRSTRAANNPALAIGGSEGLATHESERILATAINPQTISARPAVVLWKRRPARRMSLACADNAVVLATHVTARSAGALRARQTELSVGDAARTPPPRVSQCVPSRPPRRLSPEPLRHRRG